MRSQLCGSVLVVVSAAACSKGPSPSSDAATGSMVDALAPATITLTNQQLSGAAVNAGLVAFQDGDGAWRAVTGNAGVYAISVAQQRYSLLVACERTTGAPLAYVTIRHYAVSDGAALYASDNCNTGNAPRVTISGTVAGVAMTDTATISDGVSSFGGTFTSWQLGAVAGAGSLLGVRYTDGRAVGLVFQRVNFAEGATFPLDFAAQVFPAESDVTVDPTASNPAMFTTYVDEHGGSYTIDSTLAAVPTYRALPADRVGDGLSSLQLLSSASGAFRQVVHYFKTPTAQTLTLPAAYLPAAPAVVATAPYAMPAMTLPTEAAASYYDVGFSAMIKGGAADESRFWDLIYSAAWVGDASSIAVEVPDLTAIPGWSGQWGLPNTATGVSRQWNASVQIGPATALPGLAGYDAQGRAANLMKDGDQTRLSSSNGWF